MAWMRRQASYAASVFTLVKRIFGFWVVNLLTSGIGLRPDNACAKGYGRQRISSPANVTKKWKKSGVRRERGKLSYRGFSVCPTPNVVISHLEQPGGVLLAFHAFGDDLASIFRAQADHDRVAENVLLSEKQ
ncbi:hypothetical protein [Herbaspirillum lusitanum]|uniref:hypothetical protein n=1 Tax=Herbaspirillum lusitanum TaxID=213312 RepID=UPI002237DDD2|nr:hypothetical protein [Herbaspirillum lusitanum]